MGGFTPLSARLHGVAALGATCLFTPRRSPSQLDHAATPQHCFAASSNEILHAQTRNDRTPGGLPFRGICNVLLGDRALVSAPHLATQTPLQLACYLHRILHLGFLAGCGSGVTAGPSRYLRSYAVTVAATVVRSSSKQPSHSLSSNFLPVLLRQAEKLDGTPPHENRESRGRGFNERSPYRVSSPQVPCPYRLRYTHQVILSAKGSPTLEHAHSSFWLQDPGLCVVRQIGPSISPFAAAAAGRVALPGTPPRISRRDSSASSPRFRSRSPPHRRWRS